VNNKLYYFDEYFEPPELLATDLDKFEIENYPTLESLVWYTIKILDAKMGLNGIYTILKADYIIKRS